MYSPLYNYKVDAVHAEMDPPNVFTLWEAGSHYVEHTGTKTHRGNQAQALYEMNYTSQLVEVTLYMT